MGVAPGDHALNPPQSETLWAWGSRSANVTLTVRDALGDGAGSLTAAFCDEEAAAGGTGGFVAVLGSVGRG